VIEFLYDLLSDDEIQHWLSYSALGKQRNTFKYPTALAQRTAFESIEMLSIMYDKLSSVASTKIDDKLNQLLQQHQAKLNHEEVMLEAENYITQRLSVN